METAFSMLGIAVSTFHVLFILLQQPYVLFTVMFPISQMRKPKLREVKQFSQGQTAFSQHSVFGTVCTYL